MDHWSRDAIFYHVYPLGYCGAPARNDFISSPVPRLDALTARLDCIRELGADALYLGPVFESSSHGYDPVDHRLVDRRLGDAGTLRRLSAALKARGMRLVLDGVFNHVGVEHPWFRSLRSEGPRSPELGRFASIRFGEPGPRGDGFSYEGWNGCMDLAKLDLRDARTKGNLIAAAVSWIEDYGIDGIRLDAADCVDLDFQRELASACRSAKRDFWLMGEIVHGDYRRWAAPGLLDSTTNYECYKGLWSSFNDGNLFEIAYALDRQSGPCGIYRELALYCFADNHDVSRLASTLKKGSHLYPLYCLLFTMPGIPSIYYGSERGIEGRKAEGSDHALRPRIEAAESGSAHPDLERAIERLAALRRRLPALRRGAYRQLAVAPRLLAFERRFEGPGGSAIVAINADDAPARLDLPLPFPAESLRDELEGGRERRPAEGRLVADVPPNWAIVLAGGREG